MENDKRGIFLTDDLNQYDAADLPKKIVFSGSQLLRSNFLTDGEIVALNFRLSGAEIEAGEKSVDELNRLTAHFDYQKDGNKSVSSADLHSFLFYPLMKYGLARFQLELLVAELEQLTDAGPLQFNLGAEYAWYKSVHSEKNCLIRNPGKTAAKLKNLLSLANPRSAGKKSPSEHSLLILSYNIGHHLELFRPFIQYTLAHSTGIRFDIVVLDFFENPGFSPEKHIGEPDSRVHFHRFKDFRAFAGNPSQQFLNRLTTHYPELHFLKNDPMINARNVQYAWMEKCFRTLHPSAAFICNIHEIGRIMSETGKKYRIPSVHVDYGLFSDHYPMNSSMNFSLRACLGESTKEVWKRRGDRSDRIVPIGFLKLDEIETQRANSDNKTSLWRHLGLDASRPTIFFASTWAAPGEIYDLEKKHLVRYLSEFCGEREFNFLVKLHPLESPDDLAKLISPSRRQKICTHNELDLNDALSFSEIVITQGSSIVVESLFWGKWPVFMGIHESKKLILAGMTDKDDIDYFTPGKAFEHYVEESLNSETARTSQTKKVERFRHKILFSTDQQASKRLFEETLKLINHDLARKA